MQDTRRSEHLHLESTIATLKTVFNTRIGSHWKTLIDGEHRGVIGLGGETITHSNTVQTRINARLEQRNQWVQDHKHLVTDLRSSIFGESRECFIPDTPIQPENDDSDDNFNSFDVDF